jgi:hypothetical protein
MKTLNWIMALFGIAVGAFIILAVSIDVELVKHGLRTISAWTLATGRRWPYVAALMATPPLLIVGGLVGHLWWPRGGAEACTVWALAAAMLALLVGAAYFGHVVFPQS